MYTKIYDSQENIPMKIRYLDISFSFSDRPIPVSVFAGTMQCRGYCRGVKLLTFGEDKTNSQKKGLEVGGKFIPARAWSSFSLIEKYYKIPSMID